jgi:hypothetical protein
MDSRFGIIGGIDRLLRGGAVMGLRAAFTLGLATGALASAIIVWIAAVWDRDPTDAEFYGDQYD